MTYLGIALNLIGIALQLNPYYQSAWLALMCVFFGGGFCFLGLFGRRGSSTGNQFLQYLAERITPATVNWLVTMAVIMGLVFLSEVGAAVYKIAQREMDIQAAKAGVSTPSATPTASNER